MGNNCCKIFQGHPSSTIDMGQHSPPPGPSSGSPANFTGDFFEDILRSIQFTDAQRARKLKIGKKAMPGSFQAKFGNATVNEILVENGMQEANLAPPRNITYVRNVVPTSQFHEIALPNTERNLLALLFNVVLSNTMAINKKDEFVKKFQTTYPDLIRQLRNWLPLEEDNVEDEEKRGGGSGSGDKERGGGGGGEEIGGGSGGEERGGGGGGEEIGGGSGGEEIGGGSGGKERGGGGGGEEIGGGSGGEERGGGSGGKERGGGGGGEEIGAGGKVDAREQEEKKEEGDEIEKNITI